MFLSFAVRRVSEEVPAAVADVQHKRTGRADESWVLWVGGLLLPVEQGPKWSLNALDFDHFFDELRFGVKLSLESGEVTPGFSKYEDTCVSGSSCIHVNLARVTDGGPIAWAIAHAGSEHVGLYTSDGTHVASIDIRSPLFRRSGIPAGAETLARQYILWKRENSEIDRVFAFGKMIVTSHLRATRRIHG